MTIEWSPNVALDVRDFDKAVVFYREVMGFEQLPDESCTPKGGVLKMGAIHLHLSPTEELDLSKTNNVWFEFKVDNLESMLEKLKLAECKIGGTSKGENFEGRFISDKFGMNFHIYQRTS